MKTFGEHLQELKVRLLACTGLLAVGSIIGFIVHKPVEVWLQKPLGQTLYYSNPAGGLGFVMQISIGVGIMLALPLLLFQLMQFARPALKPIKTRFITMLIVSSLVLTVLAVIYAYAVSLPAALHFLTTFNSPGVKALISVSDYLRFLYAYLLGTVLAFQLPLLLFFANKVRRFPPGGIFKMQRPAIIGSIIFAGVITPTVDPFNQLLVAAPIIALFEVGALAVFISNRRNKPAVVFEIKRPDSLVQFVDPSLKPITRTAQRPLVAPKLAPQVAAKPIQRPMNRQTPVQAESRAAFRQPLRPRAALFMDVIGPTQRIVQG